MSDLPDPKKIDPEKLPSEFKIQMARILIAIILLATSGVYIPVAYQDLVVLIFLLSPVVIWSFIALNELYRAIDIWAAIEKLKKSCPAKKEQNT